MSLISLNRVLKTVLAGSVKLPAPADRVGFGVVVDVDNPAILLSPGQFSPRLSEPVPVARARQGVAELPSMPPSVTVAHGPDGSIPGTTVRHAGSGYPALTSETTTTRPATTAGLTPMGLAWQAVAASRASDPGCRQRQRRLGCDCQSPDRRDATRRNPNATAKQRGWQRKATPARAAKK